MTVDYTAALKYAKLVQIAGIEGSYGQTQFNAISALGYTFLNGLWSEALGERATFGYVALSALGGECVVALRGTDPRRVLEWLDDAAAILVPSPFGHGLVHAGFKAVYESLRLPGAEIVTPAAYVKSLLDSGQAASVTVCGHSLGGAVATLLAYDIRVSRDRENVTAYTFGSPRVGDESFARWYDGEQDLGMDTMRFENWLDLVPNLPTRPPFEHVETKVRLKGGAKWDFVEEHKLENYIELLSKEIGQ